MLCDQKLSMQESQEEVSFHSIMINIPFKFFSFSSIMKINNPKIHQPSFFTPS